jgi:guanine deaminase
MKNSAPKTCEKLICGTIWNLKESSLGAPHFEEIEKGAIAVDSKGTILDYGLESRLKKHYAPKKTDTYKTGFLVPGFIDTHIHFPQMNQMGCYGESLLGWLDKYIFPEEERMNHPKHANHFAPLFFDELLRNGTTTSLILSTSDYSTTTILFQAAQKAGARAFIGKASMDRLAPKALLRSVKQDKEETEELISNWHEKEERLFYALTPRFSPSCTEKMLTLLGDLAQKYPSVRIQTHFSENLEELKLVKKLFPRANDYLCTYEEFGLIQSRTVLAHALHASQEEINRIAGKGVHISHCPTSNLFLGSGLYPFQDYRKNNINISVGTDVGAGTSFSIWTTLAAAYSIQRLQQKDITPSQLLYLATIGGAKALGIENKVGNFAKGKSADIQVIDWQHKPILKERIETSKDPIQRFFACLFHFDTDILKQVYVQGNTKAPQ